MHQRNTNRQNVFRIVRNSILLLSVLISSNYVMADDVANFTKTHKAALSGDSKAQCSLGVMYANGKGVTRDYILAHMWWNISASKGNKLAAKNRDVVEKSMASTDITWATQKAKLCLKSNYKECD